MARVVGGDWWSRKSGIALLVVVVLGGVLRIALRVHSWGDVLALPIGILLAAVLIGGPGYLASRSQRRRAAQIAVDLGAQRAWAVQTGRYQTDYLAVADSAISLISKRGVPKRSWPIDQIRQVVVERVPIGTPSRIGLRIELGRHREHEMLLMIFPWFGGLWSSASEAREAKSAIDASRSRYAAQN